MIITERIMIEDKQYVRTASDEGVMIRKDGTEEMYCEAVDTEEAGFAYTETDIPAGTDELTVEDTLKMLEKLGVDTDDEE